MSSVLPQDSDPLQLSTSRGLGSDQTDPERAERDPDVSGTDPGSHGMCLTLKDHDHIRLFIQEFTFRGLLPHIEKNIRQLNDQVWPSPSLQVNRDFFTHTVVLIIMIVIIAVQKDQPDKFQGF